MTRVDRGIAWLSRYWIVVAMIVLAGSPAWLSPVWGLLAAGAVVGAWTSSVSYGLLWLLERTAARAAGVPWRSPARPPCSCGLVPLPRQAERVFSDRDPA